MRIFINRKPVKGRPWGGGTRHVEAFCDVMSHSHEITHSLVGRIDAIMMHDPRPDELGIGANEIARYKLDHPSVLVVHRVNECDARKGTNEMDVMLNACSMFDDVTVFVSEWMRGYHVAKGWVCDDTHVIVNGIDREIFKPIKHANRKVSIVSCHWSDNRFKGQVTYEWLDDFVAKHHESYEYTFIGRTKALLPHTTKVDPLFGKALGAELARHDVCVNASVNDPGPNSTIEAIACGLSTYVTVNGGGSCEFAGLDHVYGSHDELARILLAKDFQRNVDMFDSWEQCIRKYEALFTSRVR